MELVRFGVLRPLKFSQCFRVTETCLIGRMVVRLQFESCQLAQGCACLLIGFHGHVVHGRFVSSLSTHLTHEGRKSLLVRGSCGSSQKDLEVHCFE